MEVIMSKKLGIPYMGSKRKLAPEILNFITSRHNNITDFYDLFGGGGSISFNAINSYRFNVHYNELNPHIFQLVKYLKENNTLDPKFYDWVSREEFFNQINKSNEDADWYSGFVMSCWSFGNSQSGYLYGSDIEESKRLAHEFIVNNDLDAMNKLCLDMKEIINFKDIHKRRNLFCNRVQNLESLQMIEHLSRMQNLKNLNISSFSYENVNIIGKNPVIYCDIPYNGTGEYKEGGFDHDKFYKWFEKTPFPAYLSEYDAPFKDVYAFKHRSLLSAINNSKKTIEKIFWNGKGEVFKTELF